MSYHFYIKKQTQIDLRCSKLHNVWFCSSLWVVLIIIAIHSSSTDPWTTCMSSAQGLTRLPRAHWQTELRRRSEKASLTSPTNGEMSCRQILKCHATHLRINLPRNLSKTWYLSTTKKCLFLLGSVPWHISTKAYNLQQVVTCFFTPTEHRAVRTYFCHMNFIVSSTKGFMKVQSPVAKGRGSIWHMEPAEGWPQVTHVYGVQLFMAPPSFCRTPTHHSFCSFVSSCWGIFAVWKRNFEGGLEA